MRAQITLRDFAPQDQQAVRQLILDGLREHWGTIDETLNPELNDIAAAFANGRTIVAERDGALAGTGTVRPFDVTAAEIVRMSVPAAHRRTGIGRAIVDELLRTATAWGVTNVVLETSSAWSEVIAFYVSCGFTITGTAMGAFGEDTWFQFPLQ